MSDFKPELEQFAMNALYSIRLNYSVILIGTDQVFTHFYRVVHVGC